MEQFFEDAYYKKKAYEYYKTLDPQSCGENEKIVLNADKQWRLTDEEIQKVY